MGTKVMNSMAQMWGLEYKVFSSIYPIEEGENRISNIRDPNGEWVTKKKAIETVI